MRRKDHEVRRIMKECKFLRNECNTGYLQLQRYFEFMLMTILEKDNFFNCNAKQMSRDLFHKNFFSSFQKMSQLQEAKYYYFMLNATNEFVNGNQSRIQPVSVIENQNYKSKQFEVDIIKKGFFDNTEKVHYLQIDKKKAILLVKSENNPYDLQINLEGYLVRQSGRNKKNNSRKEFLILKSSDEPTHDQIRFAMKDVYDFPVFFTQLWNFLLELHARKLKKIIEELSEGGSRKGFVEIVLQENNMLTKSGEGSERRFYNELSSEKSYENFTYLDVRHPVSKIPVQKYEKYGVKQASGAWHFLWGKQWQKTEKGSLKNINYEYIAIQRSAVKKVIKSFISMGNGQSQMPIEMYGNESNLVGLARASKYFSYFFETRKQQCHQIQQVIIDGFKKAFSSIIGFLLIRNRMQKPIQPFLGQTYQGFIDGFPIYAQQISKNQSYILFQTSQIKLYGKLELKTGISGLNSIQAGSKGFLTLQLLKLNKSPIITFTLPMIELSGLIYGDRLVQINDTSVIYEEQSNTICILNWGKIKKPQKDYKNLNQKLDFVKGQIIKLKPEHKFQIRQFIENTNYLKQFTKQNYTERNLGELYGNWTNQLFFKNTDSAAQSIFKVEDEKPGQLIHYIQPLSSDSRLRKDVRLLQSDSITEAQKQRKKGLENQYKEETIRLIYKRS